MHLTHLLFCLIWFVETNPPLFVASAKEDGALLPLLWVAAAALVVAARVVVTMFCVIIYDAHINIQVLA